MPRKSTSAKQNDTSEQLTVNREPVEQEANVTTDQTSAAKPLTPEEMPAEVKAPPVEATEVKPAEESKSRVEIKKPIVQQQPLPQVPASAQSSHLRQDYGGQAGVAKPQYQRPASAQGYGAAKPTYQDKTEEITGVLDIGSDNNGQVRPKFTPSNKDAYINAMQIRRLGLRAGDMITGAARAAREGEKYGLITRIDKVNGMEVSAALRRPNFNDLVPIFAQKQAKLETDGTIISTRIIDLFSPIGFGQRGMIVSPPKAGKTTLLKEIAAGVAINYPEVHLMAVLVGERPEEVTDMQRFISI